MCTRNLTHRLRSGFHYSALASSALAPMSNIALNDLPLYGARQQAHEWVEAHLDDTPEIARTLREQLLPHPCAVWLTNDADVRVARRVARAADARGELFQLVLYNVPNRDCGGLSTGGAYSRDSYLLFVRSIARAIGRTRGIIIVEPDALAHASNFTEDMREERLALLRDAVTMLRRHCPRTAVYIDAGHPGWLSANTAAGLLKTAGVLDSQGFSLNVSHHHDTRTCVRYAQRVRGFLGDRMRFVIDVSRNGMGFIEDGEMSMFNNIDARVGERPAICVADNGLDAVLWVKIPGESDGACKGAPPAGLFWPEAAMRLLGVDDESDEGEGEEKDS